MNKENRQGKTGSPGKNNSIFGFFDRQYKDKYKLQIQILLSAKQKQ